MVNAAVLASISVALLGRALLCLVRPLVLACRLAWQQPMLLAKLTPVRVRATYPVREYLSDASLHDSGLVMQPIAPVRFIRPLVRCCR